MKWLNRNLVGGTNKALPLIPSERSDKCVICALPLARARVCVCVRMCVLVRETSNAFHKQPWSTRNSEYWLAPINYVVYIVKLVRWSGNLQTKDIISVQCTVPGVPCCVFGVDLCGGQYLSSSAGAQDCKVKRIYIISSCVNILSRHARNDQRPF
jgi:hypothetical protein